MNNKVYRSRKFAIDVYSYEIPYVVDVINTAYGQAIEKMEIETWSPYDGAKTRWATIRVFFTTPRNIDLICKRVNNFLDEIRGLNPNE